MLRIPGALWRRLGLAALVIAGLGGAALVGHWGTRRAPPRQPVFVSTAEIGPPGSAIPERVIVVHTGSDWPVIVAAGIAAMATVIAPALVIFREEYRQQQQRERERCKLRVWWAVRDLENVAYLESVKLDKIVQTTKLSRPEVEALLYEMMRDGMLRRVVMGGEESFSVRKGARTRSGAERPV